MTNRNIILPDLILLQEIHSHKDYIYTVDMKPEDMRTGKKERFGLTGKIFEKTLEKRKHTAEYAEALFK